MVILFEQRTDFRKSHHFDKSSNGIPLPDHTIVRRALCELNPGSPKVSSSSTSVQPPSQTISTLKSQQSEDYKNDFVKDLKIAPKWIANSNQILTFQAYHEFIHTPDHDDGLRIIPCTIYFYLEDNTISIRNRSHPSCHEHFNDLFLRRQRVPHETKNRNVNFKDLRIGLPIRLFDTIFHLIDCDGFTREFYVNQCENPQPNVHSTNSKPPKDKLEIIQDAKTKFVESGKKHKESVDAKKTIAFYNAQNGARALQQRARDLRFYNGNESVIQLWAVPLDDNDAQQYSESMKFNLKSFLKAKKQNAIYVLKYYAIDGTLEIILNHLQLRLGEGFDRLLVGRNRVPKREFLSMAKSTIGWNSEQLIPILDENENNQNLFISSVDLKSGNIINIWGRQFLLLDNESVCPDDLIDSREFHNIPINSESEFEIKRRKQIRARRLIEFQGIQLRWKAKLEKSNEENDGRRFAIVVFPSDDTIAVYEQKSQSRPHGSCKFFDRCTVFVTKNNDIKHETKVSEEVMTSRHLSLGQLIFIHSLSFRIIDVDQFTTSFLSDHPELLVPLT